MLSILSFCLSWKHWRNRLRSEVDLAREGRWRSAAAHGEKPRDRG